MWVGKLIFKHLDLIEGNNNDGWWDIKKKYVFFLGSSRIFSKELAALEFKLSALSIIINFARFSIWDVSLEKKLYFWLDL